MRYRIIFGVLLAFLILMPTVYGNRLWIKQEFTNIGYVYEIDDVNGNDLYVDMVFQLNIFPSLKNISNTAVIEFKPDVYYGEPVVKNITICENDGYGAGLTYGSISIRCKETPQILNIEQMKNFEQVYLLTITVENLTTFKSYIVRIMYKIPNFVRKEGTNNVLGFQSSCQPNGVPCNIDNWERIIRLPLPTSVLVDSSENVYIKGIGGMGDDRWILTAKGGGPFFIRYYDSNERDLYVPFYWSLLGAIFGAIISAIFGLIFKKCHFEKAIPLGHIIYRKYQKIKIWMLRAL